jgi:hypothetical protein
MSVTIESMDILKEYFSNVLKRADHHAKEVQEVALTLLGAVIWKSIGEVSVMETKDGFGNVLWFRTESGDRYAMSYNHAEKKIDLRQHSVKGETLYQFDNLTPAAQVFGVFGVM